MEKDHTTKTMIQESTLDHELNNCSWIQERLIKAFPGAIVSVMDTRGDDQHLAVMVKSAAFLDKSPIQCHRMIHAALDHMRQGAIHALSITTHYSPQE